MSLEDNLLEQRVKRTAEIEALGFHAYGRRFDFTHTIPEIVANESSKTAEELDANKPRVRVAGRIRTMRGKGKAGFMHLEQGGERLQVYVKIDLLGEEDFKLYQLLDIGDIIGVDGTLFRTRTGELSVQAAKLTFLSKTLLSMPEKFHGLTDQEQKYRQRYVDLIMNEDARRVFQQRSRIVQEVRNFMQGRGYLEVETPMMQPIPGGANAKPFKTFHNALEMEFFLRIAPELYLKRLVVGGLEKVFEINRNFRNEGISTRHNPEFTMIEFYEAYRDYRYLMDFTEEMLRTVATKVLGTTKVPYGGDIVDLGAPFARLTAPQAIRKYNPEISDANKLFSALAGTPGFTLEETGAQIHPAVAPQDDLINIPVEGGKEINVSDADRHLSTIGNQRVMPGLAGALAILGASQAHALLLANKSEAQAIRAAAHRHGRAAHSRVIRAIILPSTRSAVRVGTPTFIASPAAPPPPPAPPLTRSTSSSPARLFSVSTATQAVR